MSQNMVPAPTASQDARRAGYIFIVLATIALVVLSFAAHQTPYWPVDLAAARAVQSVQVPGYDAFMQAVSWPGFPPQVYAEVLALVLVFWFFVSRRAALILVGVTVLVGGVGLVIKMIVDRPRPPTDLIHVIIPNLDGGKYSFPAGHVQSVVAILGFVAFVVYTMPRRDLRHALVIALCLAMIVLMGVSRVYSGEHWLSDVVGGYLLGAILLVGAIELYVQSPERRGEHAKQKSAAQARAPSAR